MKKVEVLPRASGGRKNDPTKMIHASGSRSNAKPPHKNINEEKNRRD